MADISNVSISVGRRISGKKYDNIPTKVRTNVDAQHKDYSGSGEACTKEGSINEARIEIL